MRGTPRLIISFGAHASRWLLHNYKKTRLDWKDIFWQEIKTGEALKIEAAGEEISVIILPHPSNANPLAWIDFKMKDWLQEKVEEVL